MSKSSVIAGMRNLRFTLNDTLDKELKDSGIKIRDALADATPVDTGNARDSWSADEFHQAGGDGQQYVSIKNHTDYIQYLNQGTSKQAPEHFIEKTVIKFGKPQGVIVKTV